jgi:hypothetical protein
MWSQIVSAMLVPPIIVVAIMLGQYFQLCAFRRNTPEFKTSEDLYRFKRLASIQMYSSLFGLVMMASPLAFWIADMFWFGESAWLDIVFVIVPFAVECAVAFLVVGKSRAVRSTPTSDPVLASERDQVVEVWLHRALPNW